MENPLGILFIITGLDRKIDALVYALYGMTEEEIRIVKGGEG